jgi:hypothetical protein
MRQGKQGDQDGDRHSGHAVAVAGARRGGAGEPAQGQDEEDSSDEVA